MRRNFFPASEESAGCPAQRLISFSQRSMFRAARGTPTDTVRSGWWWIVSAATPLSRPSDGPSAFLPTLHPGSLFCGCQHNGPNRNNHFNLFFSGLQWEMTGYLGHRIQSHPGRGRHPNRHCASGSDTGRCATTQLWPNGINDFCKLCNSF